MVLDIFKSALLESPPCFPKKTAFFFTMVIIYRQVISLVFRLLPIVALECYLEQYEHNSSSMLPLQGEPLRSTLCISQILLRCSNSCISLAGKGQEIGLWLDAVFAFLAFSSAFSCFSASHFSSLSFAFLFLLLFSCLFLLFALVEPISLPLLELVLLLLMPPTLLTQVRRCKSDRNFDALLLVYCEEHWVSVLYSYSRLPACSYSL